MSSFSSPLSGTTWSLPLEMLPEVLRHLQSPVHLRLAALVSRDWNVFANERLYDHCWVKPWEKGAEDKLPLLLDTLGNVPELSKLVKKLEIRSYPPPINIPPALVSNTLLTLLALPNLTTLSWTRDKSLSTALLSVIARCMPNLRDLEINAHSAGQFDPAALLEIKGLKRMGLIMPDRATVGVLGRWWEALAGADGNVGLERLMIICQSSPLITDELLINSASSLSNLTDLSLTACTRITEKPILALLAGASTLKPDSSQPLRRGITRLSLEYLPHVSQAKIHDAFPGLNIRPFAYLSLTLPPPTDASDTSFMAEFLAPHETTLRTLHLSTPIPRYPWTTFILPPNGLPNLTLLSLPSPVFLPSEIDLSSALPKLERLFVPVHAHLWLRFVEIVGSGEWKHGLRTVHIVSPHAGAEGRGAWEPGMGELMQLARSGKGLRQVGFRTRVYDVIRTEEVETNYWSKEVGQVKEVVRLERFDTEKGGRVPDVFALGRFLG